MVCRFFLAKIDSYPTVDGTFSDQICLYHTNQDVFMFSSIKYNYIFFF